MANVKPEELVQIDYRPPQQPWTETSPEFRKGTFCYGAHAKNVSYLGLPNPREWQPSDADWKLPPDWKQIILTAMKERLDKYRSFRLFMDICVRCGACADKCHFFIGTGDPKNMPVLRAELMRSIYRRYFTVAGRLFPKLAGARDLTEDVLRVVLLFPPVHRVPTLFGLLSLRDRHRRDHHDRARVAQPGGLQYQLDSGAGRQLLSHRQPSRDSAARL
jgi:ferredoxin